MVKGIRGPKSVSFLLATQNQTIEVYNQIDWLLAVFSLATSPIGNASSPLNQAWINVAVLNQGTQFIDWRDSRILIYVHPKKNFTLTALIGGWGNLYARIFSCFDFKQFERKNALTGSSCALRFLTALKNFSVTFVKRIVLKDAAESQY